MTVKEHYQKGNIKDLFNAGFISGDLVTYFRYNEVFEAYLKQGYNRNTAYNLTADECGRSKKTIMLAVKVVNR